jgi:tetratricopeptide (TPR) repeat protein
MALERLLLVLALAACSAPATPRSVADAERLDRAGRDQEAAHAYAVAARERCDGRRQNLRWCAGALAGQASALARLERRAEAAAILESIPAAAPPDAAARALVAAAELRLALGEEERAWALLWRALVEYPDETGAEDALRHLVRDGRRRNPRQLHGVLVELHGRLGATAAGDNLLYAIAELAGEELGDPLAAIDACDRLAARYPDSPLRDDALWTTARLLRARGDAEGALRRLRALLATRERAFLVGSYHSVHLDDAQLEAALVLRDDLRRPREAIEELGKLPAHYPDSILRDDALVELAATHAALGDRARACAALADLRRRHPDSRHLLERAPSLRARLGCP